MNKSNIYKAKEDKDIQEDLRKLEALQKEFKALEQEQKTDTWSIKDVADTLEKHGLIAEQEPCEDAISRQAVCNIVDAIRDCISVEGYWAILERLKKLPSVNPQKPKTRYISIDDVMSVFDDFMCGEVDEDGTETFLEMLKDKAESEVRNAK